MAVAKKLGGPAPAAPVRLVRADDQRRSDPMEGTPLTTVFIAVERNNPLPIVALDGSMQPIARFKCPLSAAQYIAADALRTRTLPQRVLDHLNALL